VGRTLGLHHQTVQRCVERAVAEGPLAAQPEQPLRRSQYMIVVDTGLRARGQASVGREAGATERADRLRGLEAVAVVGENRVALLPRAARTRD
jgi:hypothetical protein